MYKSKITHLEEMHRILNKQIDDMEKDHPYVEVQKLTEMKKQKLAIRDEIGRLNKLQWEHEHEHLDYGDDR
jgi:hypothetical protein